MSPADGATDADTGPESESEPKRTPGQALLGQMGGVSGLIY